MACLTITRGLTNACLFKYKKEINRRLTGVWLKNIMHTALKANRLRNIKRFPDDFMLELAKDEFKNMFCKGLQQSKGGV